MNLGGKAIHLLLGGSLDLDGIGQLAVPRFQVFTERAGGLASSLLDRREIDQIAAHVPILNEAEQHDFALALGQRPDSVEKTVGRFLFGLGQGNYLRQPLL